jgi:hypothetical protein
MKKRALEEVLAGNRPTDTAGVYEGAGDGRFRRPRESVALGKKGQGLNFLLETLQDLPLWLTLGNKFVRLRAYFKKPLDGFGSLLALYCLDQVRKKVSPLLNWAPIFFRKGGEKAVGLL